MAVWPWGHVYAFFFTFSFSFWFLNEVSRPDISHLSPAKIFLTNSYTQWDYGMQTMGVTGFKTGWNNEHARSVITWIRETVWGVFLTLHINYDLRVWHFLRLLLCWYIFFHRGLGLNILTGLGSIWERREKWFVSASTMLTPTEILPPVPNAAGCLTCSVPSTQASASQISLFLVTTHLSSCLSWLCKILWCWSSLGSTAWNVPKFQSQIYSVWVIKAG